VRGGSNGVTGLNGIRDLVVTQRSPSRCSGVSSIANAVVVFNRSDDAANTSTFGRLTFVQSRTHSVPATDWWRSRCRNWPMPATTSTCTWSPRAGTGCTCCAAFSIPAARPTGTVQLQRQYVNNSGGITRMSGPRDVSRQSGWRTRVRRCAVRTQHPCAFDRDSNRSSASFGSLVLVETRTDGLDGVDGLNTVYAVAVSPDSRHVYAAGFGDNAVPSFIVGTGSSCSASGGGDIDDLVDLGRGGTLVYRVTARIRPDATGTLENTATVTLPPRVSDSNPANNTADDSTTLTPRADLSVSKTNDRVSVVAGDAVTYEVVVRNAGLSNIASNLTLTDILADTAGFVQSSVQWSCIASGSGALDFVEAQIEGTGGISGLDGVSSLALVPDSDGGGPLGAYLAGASVLDDSLVLFERDEVDGRLTQVAHVAHGSTLNGQTVAGLSGARAVAASTDGKFLYVVARTSDALSVFKLDAAAADQCPSRWCRP
jgi:uncharacterized repeat protein (TIGR01451 family)